MWKSIMWLLASSFKPITSSGIENIFYRETDSVLFATEVSCSPMVFYIPESTSWIYLRSHILSSLVLCTVGPLPAFSFHTTASVTQGQLSSRSDVRRSTVALNSYVTMSTSSPHLITWASYHLTSSPEKGSVQYKVFWEERLWIHSFYYSIIVIIVLFYYYLYLLISYCA